VLAEKGYWPAIASEYFAAGKYSKAVDLCQQKLESEANVVSGRVILARSLYHAGQYVNAKEQFLQVLKYDATNLVALKYLGDILYRDGEEATALAYYRRIFEIDPHCQGLSCPLKQSGAVEVKQLTIRRARESITGKKSIPLREPAFITETVGDIYREQGYLQLAREVYRRLLKDKDSSRIMEKLSETEEKLDKKEGIHEDTHR
jgi:tetratricopeptide (TPR) repeat protein